MVAQLTNLFEADIPDSRLVRKPGYNNWHSIPLPEDQPSAVGMNNHNHTVNPLREVRIIDGVVFARSDIVRVK